MQFNLREFHRCFCTRDLPVVRASVILLVMLLFLVGCSGEAIVINVENEQIVSPSPEPTDSKVKTDANTSSQSNVVKTRPLKSATEIPAASTPIAKAKAVSSPPNTPTPARTMVPTLTATSVPEPTATQVNTPAPRVDSAATAVPPTPAKTPSATPISLPSPVVSNTPTNVSTPPSKTDTNSAEPILITKVAAKNKFQKYGFSIDTADSVQIVEGRQKLDSADDHRGTIAFRQGGTLAILEWSSESETDNTEFLAQAYSSLKGSTSDWSFVELNEGTITVDGFAGVYGAFAAGRTVESQEGFGLVSAWGCQDEGTKFSLSLTGREPTVVQVRFRTLIDSFRCGGLE